MAIDHDSGSGWADKVGPIVRIVNALDRFEITDLDGDMDALYAELSESNLYHQILRDYLTSLWTSMNNALRSFKEQCSEPIRQVLAGAIIDPEDFHSEILDDLLAHLWYTIERDDRKFGTVSIAFTGGYYLDSDTAKPEIVICTKYMGEASPVDLQSAKGNKIRVTCIDESVPGAEVCTLACEMEPTGPGDPAWQNAGDLGQARVISADSSENLIENGGFERFTGSVIDGWVAVAGAWGTDFQTSTLHPARGNRCLRFYHNGGGTFQLMQMLRKEDWVANSPYILALQYYSSTAAPANDLDFKVYAGTNVLFSDTYAGGVGGFGRNAVIVRIGTDETDIPITLEFVNTAGANPYMELFIDELILVPVTQYEQLGGLGVNLISGRTDPETGDRRTATVIRDVPDSEWSTFFARYFGLATRVGDGGSVIIADALTE